MAWVVTAAVAGAATNSMQPLLPMPSPLHALAENLRKPVRFLNFWRQAVHIYSSYKVTQLHAAVKGVLPPTLGGGRGRGCSSSRSSSKSRSSSGGSSSSGDEVWEETHERNSQRMMNLCLGMRGFYLKTGQFLGTRHDFMPPNYTSKLSKLHDDVPPLTKDEIRRVLEGELRGPVEEFFDDIDLDTPVGSASIAQVTCTDPRALTPHHTLHPRL